MVWQQFGNVDYSEIPSAKLSTHNTAIFDKIGVDMTKLVNKLTKERAIKMTNILRYRQSLGGNRGRFPRSVVPRSNGHSFKDWRWEERNRKGKGRKLFVVLNDHRNPNDDYPYVDNLLFGTNWSKRVWGGDWVRIGQGYNGGLFSTQMPNGITGWTELQKRNLIRDIKRASGEKRLRK